ncbi:unnamed protein product [Hyaloperonospora brassicae]|uniref:RING-type domain-containing protein n=2 Tax=Hyaloperonospora brassicae TaxID=162125 RepID=A0AAV0THM4_HYABA|nr:unnamed protein product [Hyaloperonospora brassicae]
MRHLPRRDVDEEVHDAAEELGRAIGGSEGPRMCDEDEEKAAEGNEFFSTRHFLPDSDPWGGPETVYSSNPQRSLGFMCPFCLCVTHLPAQQDCGHVLCFSCLQQSLSTVGACTLCQAQQMLEIRETALLAAPEQTMGMPCVRAERAGHLPISTSAHLSVLQRAVGQADHVHVSRNKHSMYADTDMFAGYEANKGYEDLVPNTSAAPFLFDSLSDLDDLIDLDDLVSSDSEQPSSLVAEFVSLDENVTVEPSRHPRTSLPKRSFDSKKTKARKLKRGELGATRMEWQVVRSEGSPPDPRYDCGLAMYGNVMIVVGGIVGELRLNDLYTLDLAAKPLPQWIRPPVGGVSPPLGHLLQIFVIDDNLYAIGGTTDGNFLTELHRLHLKCSEWKWEKIEVAGTPPSMRYWYSLTVLQGMAILYGGYGHPRRLSDTFALRFDTEVPTWVELQPRGEIPGSSSTHSVCVINDRMYIFGGYDGKCRRGQLFSFEIEDASSEHIDCVWCKVETQGRGPALRYTHSSASIGSQLIVYGGNTGCLKGDAYVLDVGADEDIPIWKPVKCDPPLTPRAWHRTVVCNGAMYVFGGNTADGKENNVVRIAFSAA